MALGVRTLNHNNKKNKNRQEQIEQQVEFRGRTTYVGCADFVGRRRHFSRRLVARHGLGRQQRGRGRRRWLGLVEKLGQRLGLLELGLFEVAAARATVFRVGSIDDLVWVACAEDRIDKNTHTHG